VTKNIDAILSAAKMQVSSESGFIHQDRGALIPLWDNALYAYALMKAHTVEQVQEGRSRLKRVLAFQIHEGSDKGFFPSLLSDFPFSHDRHLQARLYLLFLLFLKEAVGADLKKELEKVLKEMSLAIQNIYDHLPVALQLVIRMSDGSIDANIVRNVLANVAAIQIGDLGALVLAVLHLQPTLLPEIIPLMDFWAPNVGRIRVLQTTVQQHAGVIPTTLFDFALFALNGMEVPKEKLGLEYALIPDLSPVSFVPKQEVQTDGCQSTLGSTYMIATNSSSTPYHLFFRNWSMVVSSSKCTVEHEGGVIRLLPKEGEFVFEKEAAPLFSIYWNHHCGNHNLRGSFLVEGSHANIVRSGESIRVEMMDGGFEVTYTIEACDVLGHVVRGNRPAEVCAKGANRFSSYDWQFFVRPVRAPLPKQVLITIKPFAL